SLARAHVSAPQPDAVAVASLLQTVADSGIDIVRMPPRPPGTRPAGTPTAVQPPTVTPPPIPPATPPVAIPPGQAPQPQGRIVKLTAKVGAQPREPQKGWLGVQM